MTLTAQTFNREAELTAAEAARATRMGTTAVPGVYACIVKVSAEIAKDGIGKTRTNQQQGYKFRGIDDVLNALAPMLARHGLVILPRCLSRTVVGRATKAGSTLFYVTVEAEFDFVCAADGSTHTVRMYGEAMDSADKATNKAMSAAYKYAAFQTFCIPTEGDTDADATTFIVEAPAAATATIATTPAIVPAAATGETRGTPFGISENVIVSPLSAYAMSGFAVTDADLGADCPPGFARIDDFKPDPPFWHVTWGRDAQDGRRVFKTKIQKIADAAHEAFQQRVPVRLHSKKFPWLDKVEVAADDAVPF